MRVTTAFSRLLRLKGVWVKKVCFEHDRVVVFVALRRRRLVCPLCEYSTRARRDTRPTDSVWRHLDLGTWRLEIRCRRRRLRCPEHGARAEGVPFARPGCEFTRDFECLVAWLATRTDKSTVKRLVRIDWDTVGRIVARVCADELDGDRLEGLFDIGIDEVSWRKQHRYLTLVVDHQRRCVVWGTEGAGAQAADRFFAALDPEPASDPPGPDPPEIGLHSPEPLDPEREREDPEPPVGERASQLRAISLDMGPGYAKSAREHAPQAIICIDPYHVVQLANRALDEVRRDYWNQLRRIGDKEAAKRFKDARWVLLKRPENLTAKQAATHRELQRAGRRRMARLHTQGSAQGHLPRRAHPRRRHRPDRSVRQPRRPQPPTAIHPPRPDGPQTPRRDPRRDPPRHQPGPHRSAQQQGPPDHPPRLRLSLRPSRARPRDAHLRTDHPRTPTRVLLITTRPTLTTSMPRDPEKGVSSRLSGSLG